jgi:hypothetical protein
VPRLSPGRRTHATAHNVAVLDSAIIYVIHVYHPRLKASLTLKHSYIVVPSSASLAPELPVTPGTLLGSSGSSDIRESRISPFYERGIQQRSHGRVTHLFSTVRPWGWFSLLGFRSLGTLGLALIYGSHVYHRFTNEEQQRSHGRVTHLSSTVRPWVGFRSLGTLGLAVIYGSHVYHRFANEGYNSDRMGV